MGVKPKTKRTNYKRELGDPYAEGADAAMEGKPGNKNPYKPDDIENHRLWAQGWDSVAEDETIEIDED